MAESNLELAGRLRDRAELEGAHGSLGLILLCTGDFVSSREHLEQAAALCATAAETPGTDRHPLMYPGAYPHALVLWLLGYPDRAVHQLRAVLAAQEPRAGPFDRMTGYEYCIMLFHWLRDWQEMQLYAQKLLALTEQYEYETYRWLVPLYEAVAASALGQPNAGSGMLARQSIDHFLAQGLRMYIPYALSLLAEVHAHAGQWDEGLAVLDEALELSAATDEHRWDAEVHRLRGDLLAAGAVLEAERAYEQALAVARSQRAKSLELRAAMSLGQLWRDQGKPEAARRLVAEVYAWFTEGFASPDLRAAAAFLSGL